MADRRRTLLRGREIVLAAGAHDALSAKLAEEAGFDAIWASGFGISAVQAVPDANILTLTETLDAVRRIVDAVGIPVIADCDNGYGNAINVMRTAAEFERAGAAGICIEDNEFPKRCSFYAGVRRDLVPAEEHARKIEAATAARRDPGFIVIARTEALIVGLGLEEALRRARAYAAAGADAVLVHSKSSDFNELRAFAAAWDGPVPLVAVPTTYPGVGAAELEAAGFRMAIFANQALRAAIVGMRDALRDIRRSGRAATVEERIAPLEEVYALVGVPELKANEQRFLFSGDEAPRAVILAAGFEPQLMPLIDDRPKAMLEVNGRPILVRQVETLRRCGVRDVVVVRGYKKERVIVDGARFVDNDRFAETGEVHSLFDAERELDRPFVLLYGDIVFDPAILVKLLQTRADIAVVVDRAFHDAYRAGIALAPGPLDLVVTETPPNGRRFVAPEGGSRVLRIGPEVAPEDAHGEFIGMAMFSAAGAAALRAVHAELASARAEGLERASVTHLLQAMIDRRHPVTAVEIHKGWMEIDTIEDYRRVCAELAR
jgi:phosphoenolpyruvate phosphomutase